MTNDVSAQLLLAFLNSAWNRAALGANTLLATLQNDQQSALGLISSGSIASVGKNSANQSYKGYGAGSLTQVQIVEAIGNLLGLYQNLQSQITNAFLCSTQFNKAVPAGFDFDDPVYGFLTTIFNNASGPNITLLPDITSIRLPASIALPTLPTSW